MSSVITQRYRQKPYGDTYTIEYRRQSDGHYDIFATEHPQNPFDESVVKCHLYSSGEVCVAAGKEPRTLDRAKAIAFTWMDGYSAYCRTGNFPTGSKRVNV